MATISITTTGVAVGDGTKTINFLPLPSQNLHYAFGETLPTEWIPIAATLEPWTFAVDMGKLWLKTSNTESVTIKYFIGA